MLVKIFLKLTIDKLSIILYNNFRCGWMMEQYFRYDLKV